MTFKTVIPLDKAEEEVNKFLDLRKITPKRRADLETPVAYLTEAVSLGFVNIADDGKITQTLMDPVGALTELVYAPRVAAATVQSELNKLTNQSVAAKTLLYLKLYTGLLPTQLNQLESSDRNYADTISLFFM